MSAINHSLGKKKPRNSIKGEKKYMKRLLREATVEGKEEQVHE